LKFTSALTATGAGSKTLTLQGSTNGTGEIAAAIVDNSGTHKTSVVKGGTGAWTLSGTNTNTGTTTINGGTLQFAKQVSLYNNTTASWSAANINVKNGGTLAFNVGGTGEFTTANLTTLLTNLAASSSATNGMNAGSNFGFDTTNATDGTFTIAAVIANSSGASGGARGLTKLGTNILVLGNTNTYTGKTSVRNGTVSFAAGNASSTANQALGANADLDLGVASVSSGRLLYTGGAGTLAKNINALGNGTDTVENSGSGLLTLTGTLTKNGTVLTLKGGSNGITVSGSGTIAGSSANSDLVVDGGLVTLETANTYNGPTFIINGATLNANAANALPTANGRTAISMDQSGSGSSTLALGASQSVASLTGAAGSVLDMNGNTLTIGSASGTTTFAGVISDGSLTKDGASIQTLTGTNTYAGATTVSAGTLRAGAAAGGQAFGNGSAVTLADVAGAILDLNGYSQSIGSLAGGGSTGGNITLGANAILTLGSDNSNTTFAGIISGTGTSGLTKVGDGTLTLTGTNTYTGATTVNGGILQLSGSGSINGSNVTVNGGSFVNNSSVAYTGILTLNNANLGGGTINGNITYGGGGTVSGSSSVTGSVGTSSGSFEIQSGANLTVGSGLNVSGTAGLVIASNASVTGSLNYSSSLNSAIAGGIAGASQTLTKSGSSTLTLSGTNTYTGATNINNGIFAVTGAGSINSTSAINVAAGAKFVYNSSTALTVAPTLNGGSGNQARFSGTATINAAMSLNNIDDVLAPGNSPGIQNFATGQTWESFSYEWELNDWVEAVAGVDYDQIQITGGLTLSGASYALNIFSLDSLNMAGLVGAGGANTFTETSKSWTILTATGGITGFNASSWMVSPTNFQDADTGAWSLAQSGNDLVLSYTVIPEPKAALLGGLGILLLLRRRR
jgi:autotransporter-associated beta strand protein